MQITKGVIALAGALALSAFAADPIVLSNTTFQDGSVPGWGYGYFYGDNRPAAPPENPYQSHQTSATIAGETGGVWAYNFRFEGLEAVSGWGTGTGGPLISTAEGGVGGFVSANRDHYNLTWRAKVAGLADGQTSVNAEMQIQLYAGDSKKLQVNIPFSPTGEWQTFTANLGAYGLGDGTTDANFAASNLELNGVRFNVNMHEPAGRFGYDAGNSLYLDDVVLTVTPVNEEPEVLIPQTITEWNFDDKTPTFQYGPFTWSQKPAVQPVYNFSANANGATPNNLGVAGSTAFWLSMNNFPLFDDMPSWAGGGAGAGGGTIETSHLASSDLTKFQITFDARVEGLNDASGRTETTGMIQIHFDVADGADEDTNPDGIGRLDFNTPGITTQFKTFTYTFNRGTVNDTTREALAAALASVVQMRLQVQIENATDVTTWDLDENNFLIVDNVKIERLYPEGTGNGGPGDLSYAKEGNELVLTWTAPTSGTTNLQAAGVPEGPYTNVTTTGNTHRVALEGTQRYFRLVWNQ